MKPYTAALIGTGRIAKFHVQSLRSVGFEVNHIAASPDSSSVADFAAAHNIANVHQDPLELCSSNCWDVIVIACKIESTSELLAAAYKLGNPILVEKPVSYVLSDFDHFGDSMGNVIVGYNRRFYETVTEAKKFIERGGKCLATIELPQSLSKDKDGHYDFNPFLSNAIHGVDLGNYLFGKLSFDSVLVASDNNNGNVGLLASCVSTGGHLVQLTVNFNASSNFSITIDSGKDRFQIRPFEFSAEFSGTEIIEPDDCVPVRRYVPKKIVDGDTFQSFPDIKPGFRGQADALMRMIEGKSVPQAATISDAKLALSQMLKFKKSLLESVSEF